MKKVVFVIGIAGILLISTALFAEQIGIDNDSGWGKGRIIMLLAGIFLIIATILIAVFQTSLLKLTEKISALISYTNQVHIFSLVAIVLVIGSYIWLILPGFKRPSTNYYSQLAIAFKRNQLNLPEQPSAALLSLSDPYDYTLRKNSGIEDFPWDTSLYKGKFYIYWGPVPSLVLTTLSSERLAGLGDQHLVFIFLCGLFLYSVLLVNNIYQKFNYNLPSWTISIALLAIGVSIPATLMLSNPKIYEAAIAGCQFFFIGGCYWAYSALSEKDSPATSKLILASVHWALALGTRITILPAIIFIAAMTFVYILQKNKLTNLKKIVLLTLPAIGIPLLVAVAGLGWYNWMRFDSVFEFGMRYQLASVNYSKFNNLFSVRYMHGNFQNYFTRPYKIQSTFPYIKSIENIIWNDKLVGLLYTAPYFLLSFIPTGYFLHRKLALKKADDIERGINSLEKWLETIFTGSLLLSLATILSYYFTAMRFTEDFMPALLLLSTIHLAQGYKLIKESKKLKHIYMFLTTLLIVFSISASILIALPESRVKSVFYYTNHVHELLIVK